MVTSGNRVALVTGATGAIGKAIARGIAASPGYEVILACRDEEKATRAVREITQATGNAKVRYEVVDLSRRLSIEALAGRWRGPLHVLVNNAAVTPRRRQETPEGIELQFATNVLGYLWMIQAFSGILTQSAPSRVVNVASYWAGDLDMTDLEFRRRRYNNNEAYRQSKQADRMLTVAFAERLKPVGVSVNACHPGDVNSTLSNNLGFAGQATPDEGARTPVWLALEPVGEQQSGRYYEQMKGVRCPFGADRKGVSDLYGACLRFSQAG
ncbi:MAG TPA: SDR family NAD(P)-dependent oxidoreductase [Candidatus Methylomirabilis sp.]|nr:SDR family NAD(P)-dependent oxidoreductase [Candidatus Methylomirabilis sp.]